MTDEEFIVWIFNRYHHTVWQYVNRRCKDPEMSADIVQDTFLLAVEKAEILKQHENVLKWLYCAARNDLLHMTRDMLTYESLYELSEDLIDDYDFEETLVNNLALYEELSRHLKPDEKLLLFMHFEEGLLYKEIAQERRTSEASIKMKFKRIFKKLKTGLAEEYGPERRSTRNIL